MTKADALTDEQVMQIFNIIKSIKILNIPIVEPDEFDLYLVKETETDDDECYVNIDDFAKELGIDPDEL